MVDLLLVRFWNETWKMTAPRRSRRHVHCQRILPNRVERCVVISALLASVPKSKFANLIGDGDAWHTRQCRQSSLSSSTALQPLPLPGYEAT